MSSTNKTANGLNQWVETDIPAMEDFNADNEKIDAELSKRSPLESPALTGTPTAPTAEVDTNTEQIATTAFVKSQPLAPLESPDLTGTPTAPTAEADTDTTQIATTAFVKNQAYAPLESPALTGTPTAPTAAIGTNTTQLATTAFVAASTTAASIPFIYQCFGTNDDLAIQNIVNNFFDSGTAMTMKLIITGTMGLFATPANNRHIDINSVNTRGAVVHLDFGDCDIPRVNDSTFLHIRGSVIVFVNGLNVNAICSDSYDSKNFGYGIYMASGTATFANCSINAKTYNTFSNFGSYCVYIKDGTAAFTNCTIVAADTSAAQATSNSVYITGGSVTLANCTIIGTFTGSAISYNVYASGGSATLVNCTIIVNGNGVTSSCSVYITGKTGSLDLGIPKKKVESDILPTDEGTMLSILGVDTCGSVTLTNCNISDINCGVYISGGTGTFSNCDISGSNKGLYIEGGAGTFMNCVISAENLSVADAIKIASTFSGILKLSRCKIIGSTYGMLMESANKTANMILEGCSVKGTVQDIKQTTAASTVKWFITNNLFSKATVIVDGTAAISYKTASAHIYFPQYANRFSVTTI